jgi:hypothetical protein
MSNGKGYNDKIRNAYVAYIKAATAYAIKEAELAKKKKEAEDAYIKAVDEDDEGTDEDEKAAWEAVMKGDS